MDLGSRSDIELALTRVGEQLAYEKLQFSIVVIGGAALNLLGLVARATSDVDIIAFARHVDTVPTEILSRPPDPIPSELAEAVRKVATDMNLDPRWMNTEPSLQWSQGLPPGLAERIAWLHYGPEGEAIFGLDVGLVSRYDLIFFKLYAATDDASTRSVHYKDLLALRPRSDELDDAANWIRPQNASPEFQSILDELMEHLKRQLNLSQT